jgi:hypothetical protein
VKKVFAVIGDFGTGIKNPSSDHQRQREVAEALRKAVTEAQAAHRGQKVIAAIGWQEATAKVWNK